MPAGSDQPLSVTTLLELIKPPQSFSTCSDNVSRLPQSMPVLTHILCRLDKKRKDQEYSFSKLESDIIFQRVKFRYERLSTYM
jgi:hypothetical protein